MRRLSRPAGVKIKKEWSRSRRGNRLASAGGIKRRRRAAPRLSRQSKTERSCQRRGGARHMREFVGSPPSRWMKPSTRSRQTPPRPPPAPRNRRPATRSVPAQIAITNWIHSPRGTYSRPNPPDKAAVDNGHHKQEHNIQREVVAKCWGDTCGSVRCTHKRPALRSENIPAKS